MPQNTFCDKYMAGWDNVDPLLRFHMELPGHNELNKCQRFVYLDKAGLQFLDSNCLVILELHP